MQAQHHPRPVERGLTVVRVPWDYDFLDEDFDGVVISNGPGDPKMCAETIEHVRRAMERGRPILGICLGNQILALAAGADTYKLKFGHRGQNQPCVLVGTSRCYITSQNHGYAVDESTLPPGWEPWFINANDGTNEGIRHRSPPVHERPVPSRSRARSRGHHVPLRRVRRGCWMNAKTRGRSSILGSGALKIGEAGEFDYSGSQAIKALKEEGIATVLVNPNIATIQTSDYLADKVYFLPVTPYFVEQVIEKERPDGILLGFGGQTALNCGLELDASGVFERYGVEVLGTPIAAIRETEDRELFARTLARDRREGAAERGGVIGRGRRAARRQRDRLSR